MAVKLYKDLVRDTGKGLGLGRYVLTRGRVKYIRHIGRRPKVKP